MTSYIVCRPMLKYTDADFIRMHKADEPIEMIEFTVVILNN